MIRYIIRRLLWLIPVLFVVSIVTFLLMHMAPGGPWDREPGNSHCPAYHRPAERPVQSDKPIYEQYALYMWVPCTAT